MVENILQPEVAGQLHTGQFFLDGIGNAENIDTFFLLNGDEERPLPIEGPQPALVLIFKVHLGDILQVNDLSFESSDDGIADLDQVLISARGLDIE